MAKFGRRTITRCWSEANEEPKTVVSNAKFFICLISIRHFVVERIYFRPHPSFFPSPQIDKCLSGVRSVSCPSIIDRAKPPVSDTSSMQMRAPLCARAGMQMEGKWLLSGEIHNVQVGGEKENKSTSARSVLSRVLSFRTCGCRIIKPERNPQNET